MRNEALPRLAYVLLGGFVGYQYLAPLLGPMIKEAKFPYAAEAASVLLGAIAGRVVGPAR